MTPIFVSIKGVRYIFQAAESFTKRDWILRCASLTQG